MSIKVRNRNLGKTRPLSACLRSLNSVSEGANIYVEKQNGQNNAHEGFSRVPAEGPVARRRDARDAWARYR